MAVYKRTYTRYAGRLTGERWRFAILSRFAVQNVFGSKISTGLFALGLLPHLIALVIIYFRNHLEALEALGIPAAQELSWLTIDGTFFLTLYIVQTFMSFFLVALIGPGLVSPDLANNALPLYLSRPFSRAEYVMGKMAVLVGLTSVTTWLPGLLLVGVQTSMAGFSWLSDNARVPIGILVGSLIWILSISLIALALSAWVKWKPVAAAALFGIFFVSAGFGTTSNVLLDMRWGVLLNLAIDMRMVWRWVFLGESEYRITTPPFGIVPAWTGLMAMAAVCGIALLMLGRKIRATQVVR
jgi:ABC-2 type transport system permease protein